jgi:hypothetical protein
MEFKIRDSGFEIQDSRFRIRDSGFKIQDASGAKQHPPDGSGQSLLRSIGAVKRGFNLLVFGLLFSVAFSASTAFAGLTEGYVGGHWLINPPRNEIVYLTFKGAERRITSIGGFADNFSLAFHPRKNYGWATNHSVFGGLVKLLPDERDIVPIDGFENPIALGLSLSDESLWVLEEEVVHLDSAGNVLARFGGLPSPLTLDASPLDSSVWVGCKNHLIKLSQTGKKLVQIETASPVHALSADLRDGGCWAAMTVPDSPSPLIKFSATGQELLRVPFQNISAVATASASGGCWVVDGDRVVLVTADGVKSDVILGYHQVTSLSRNLSDGTFWVTDQGGERLSKVPQDENEAVLAVLGLKERSDNNLKAARHVPIRLVRGVLSPDPEPDETEEIEIPSPDAVEPPDEIEPPEETEEVPEAIEETPPPVVEPVPEADSTEPDAQAPSPQVSKVETPPESDISRIPAQQQSSDEKFPGVVYIELSVGLSQKRLKNTASVLGRRYSWNFDEETYTLLLGMDVETYNSYANKDRQKLEEMVLSEVAVTRQIAAEFHKLATAQGWNGEKLVSFVLAFVQSLPYTVDKVTTGYDEFIAYAYETLVAGGGDCEDTTILATAILIGLGYDVILLNPPGHLAFGVGGNYGGSYIEHDGKRYFYCESTGTGWRIGQIPDDYHGKKFRVLPILK